MLKWSGKRCIGRWKIPRLAPEAQPLPRNFDGKRRAKELGWPNTYTLSKSLAESLLAKYGAGLPIAIVRPAIVESSTAQPFRGWNEGINTSASLSYLLGTYFRQ